MQLNNYSAAFFMLLRTKILSISHPFYHYLGNPLFQA